ncbi:sodium/hydrogen exchanger 4 [Tripterygium wilfordii]|uniref:Sodium/hydrogen exchanger 4 n=1 Tax=Tripterygium wilfordii TaxID=458696 RepID=A0A7J7C2U8_TRIWF|nr:sodium/hydrogen exchanger 4 [Tripterygium wilfordii]KAF5728438.1 sodium/hydrogen exchanger 4 [Tripterygium wilfordii]
MMELLRDCARNFGGEHELVVPITVFVAVLCLCLVVGHLLEENRWVNESITAIIIGCIAGAIILVLSKGKNSHILTFNEEVFFIYLLPPIIFNAGFQVKKKHFFQNFLTIMLFGVVGVFISALIITAGSWWLFPRLGFVGLKPQEYLAIGTIFSSTDTVCTLQVLHQDETPLLYSLVFGEGVVNDATSVVLFNAVRKIDVSRLNGRTALRLIGDFLYLFSASTALGLSAGLLTSYILKTLYFGRHSSIRELSLMVLMAYLSYMLAELFELSGILTVFICGIVMSHYAWHNVTESSRITTRHVFAMLSFIAETFIFLYVGMDALDIEKWKMTKLSFGTLMAIYSTLILLILLGRAAFVFPLSALSNYMNRRADRIASITVKHQIVIWWAGLMRGAVSIALAFKQFTYSGVTWDPINATMVTNTIVVVLFSTLVFGFLTKPLIMYLLPHHASNNKNVQPKSPKDDATLPLLSFEESAATNILRATDGLSMLMARPVYTIHHYWRRFDDTYMRPIFGGPNHGRAEC